MSNLVSRLRELASSIDGALSDDTPSDAMREAADEIERAKRMTWPLDAEELELITNLIRALNQTAGGFGAIPTGFHVDNEYTPALEIWYDDFMVGAIRYSKDGEYEYVHGTNNSGDPP